MNYVYRFRVRFCDTDSYGIVHHSNFFIYFEEARYSFAKNVLKIFDNPVFTKFKFPVLKAECNFRKPLFYNLKDYEIIVDFQLFQENKLKFTYIINKCGSDKVIANGTTIHAITRNEMLCLKVPKELEEVLNNV